VVVTTDQDAHPIPHFPTPIVAAVSPDAFPEDAAIANSPLSPIPHNSTPLPSALPFTTSLSFGRISGFLKDICKFFRAHDFVLRFTIVRFLTSMAVETPVHQFSRPVPIFDDPHDLVPSSPLNCLRPAEDLPWLMDQSIPPSTIESRPGSPIPLFEEAISRVRAQKAAAATREDQPHATARDLETGSVGKLGRLETSMSLGRIADFLGDICTYLSLLTPSHDPNSFPTQGLHPFGNSRTGRASTGAETLIRPPSPQTPSIPLRTCRTWLINLPLALWLNPHLAPLLQSLRPRILFRLSLGEILRLTSTPQHQSPILCWISVLLVFLAPSILSQPPPALVLVQVPEALPRKSRRQCPLSAKDRWLISTLRTTLDTKQEEVNQGLVPALLGANL
jgi:hypothetical protein